MEEEQSAPRSCSLLISQCGCLSSPPLPEEQSWHAVPNPMLHGWLWPDGLSSSSSVSVPHNRVERGNGPASRQEYSAEFPLLLGSGGHVRCRTVVWMGWEGAWVPQWGGMGRGPGVSRWHCLLRAGPMLSLHLGVLLRERDPGSPGSASPPGVCSHVVGAGATPPA